MITSWGQIAGTKRPRAKSRPRKLLIPLQAGVAELADAQDLKSWVPKGACGFDPRPRHQIIEQLGEVSVWRTSADSCAVTILSRSALQSGSRRDSRQPRVRRPR